MATPTDSESVYGRSQLGVLGGHDGVDLLAELLPDHETTVQKREPAGLGRYRPELQEKGQPFLGQIVQPSEGVVIGGVTAEQLLQARQVERAEATASA